jgi:hypothetical protein
VSTKSISIRWIAALCFVLCVACVAGAYLIRPKHADVIVDVATEAVDLQLTAANDWRVGAALAPVGGLAIQGGALDAAGAWPSVTDAALSGLAARAVTLDQIATLANSEIAFVRLADGCTDVRVNGGGVQIGLILEDVSAVTLSPSDATQSPPPMTPAAGRVALTWTATRSDAKTPVPALTFCPQSSVTVFAAGARSARFTTRFVQSELDARTVSAIVSGRVAFAQVARTMNLARFDALALDGLTDGPGARLTFAPSTPISFAFVGQAQAVRAGPARALTAIGPNYLELITRAPSVVSILAGLGLLWGFLWGLVTILRAR